MSTAEPWYLGIDFGTSSIVAAQRLATRSAEVIELGGERGMPSVVVADEHGGIVVGRAADNLAAAQPTRALRAPKGRLGDPSPIVLGGRAYRAVDLVGRQLHSVHLEALAVVGSLPQEVRLTHPASWSSARVAQLLEAAALAGIDHPQPVPEPVAAAAAYAEAAAVPEGGCVAVYDLGGGTFDSAVLQATRGGFVIIGRPGGEDRLGGNLFDELLANHLGARLAPDVWEALQASEELRWRQASATLRAEARRAKEALSVYPTADVLVTLPGGMAHLQVTRAELDALTRPHLQDSVTALERTIADAGLHPGQLSAIFLTGGASRMPAVEELVASAFPTVPVTRRGDPKTAVAIGATHPLAVVSGQARPGSNPPQAPIVAAAPMPPPPPAGWAPPPVPPVAPAVDPSHQTQVVAGLAAPAGAPTIATPPAGAGPGLGGSWPPQSGPPSAPPQRRRSVAPWVMLAVVGAIAVAALALLWRGRSSDTVATGATTQPSQTVLDDPTTTGSTTTALAPATTGTTVPASTVAPVVVTVTVPVPVPVPVPGPSTAPPSTSPPSSAADSCPTTATSQNRTPSAPSIGVVEYLTAEFVARICWTGSEYLYYGYDRADAASSVLIGAVPTATGWEATAGPYRYTVGPERLVVYQSGAVILDLPVQSTRDLTVGD